MKSLLLLLVVVCTLKTVSLELSEILKTCRDECNRSPNEQEYYLTPLYKSKLYKFMTSGFPAIFWESVSENKIPSHLINRQCLIDLKSVSDGISAGKIWAYQFLDSAGKSPSGILHSTLSSFGNYVECLESRSAEVLIPFEGKYCSIDIFPSKKPNNITSNDFLDLGSVPVVIGFPFVSSFCIPSTCNEQELRHVLQEVLKEYLFIVNGFVTCDTEISNSFLQRLKNATKLQWISIIILSSIIGIVFLASIHHVECIFGMRKEKRLLKSLSVIESFKGIFLVVDPESETLRRRWLEFFKMVIITCGTLSHIFVCLDTPISYFVMDRHKKLLGDLRTLTSSIINEAGFSTLSALAGFGTFLIMFPVAKSKGIPYLKIIFDRWLRYIPSIICLTALEILFPFFSSGPLWTRIANFFAGKCHKNYFLNFFFIQNWLPGLDICAGHTYYSAMDLQLFILGLIGVALFAKSYFLGVFYSLSMIVISNFVMVRNSIKYNLPSSLAIPDPTPEGIVNYLDHLHMNILIYISGYFTGVLVGWLVYTGYRFKLRNGKDHFKSVGVSLFLGLAANLLKGIHGNLKLLPESWAPLIIFFNRNAYSSSAAIFFVYIYSLPASYMERQLIKKENYSLFRGLTRLTYSVFMSNYLVIRTGFFSRTVLYPIENLPFVQHVISMYILVVLYAVLFHLFFVGPFDTLRRHFKTSKYKSE